MKHPEVPKHQPAPPHDSSRAAGVARKQPIGIIDRRGISWRVTERDARLDPGCPAERCLVFANDSVVRRVWNYPRDWDCLSDEELDILGSSRATPPLPRLRSA